MCMETKVTHLHRACFKCTISGTACLEVSSGQVSGGELTREEIQRLSSKEAGPGEDWEGGGGRGQR